MNDKRETNPPQTEEHLERVLRVMTTLKSFVNLFPPTLTGFRSDFIVI